MSQSDRELAHEMGRRVAALEAQVETLQSASHLTNASLEDTSIKVKDRDGSTRAVMGRQSDGSHGAAVVEAGPQPVPSAPLVEPGTGTISVEWDGGLQNQTVSVPRIFGRVEVWAAPDDGSDDPMRGKRLGSITDREGGTTPIKATSGDWLVWLRMVGPDGKRVSDFSESAAVTVEELVDGEQINDRLDTAEDNLNSAKDEWEQSKTDLQDGLDQINNETIPQVRTDAQQWADDAEAAAVTQAAQDAQAEYDRLQDIAEQALAGAPNVIYDPSFETDWYQQAWDGEDDLSVTANSPGTTEPTEGLQILRVSNDTGGSVTPEFHFTPVSRKGNTPTNDLLDLDMPVRAGQVWRFEVDMRALADGFDGTMRLRCMKAGSLQSVDGIGFTLSQSWETYTLDVTIPEGITSVYWRFQPTIGEGGFFADRVSVKNVTDFKQALDKAEAAAQAAQDAHDAAGEAKTQADTAMTRAGQVGSRLGGETAPVGTAPENSTWFQWSDMDDPNRTVVGVWQMIDGNWTEQDSSEPALIPTVDIGAATVGTLKAVRIDVASLYADSAFVNSLHAETVEALRVTAETGFIGGTLLEDGAITTEKLTVTESMTAAIAEFLEVKAVHMTANAVEAAHISVGALDGKIITAPLVQSHAEAATGWKLDPGDGFQVWDGAGNLAVRIDGIENLLSGRLETNIGGAGVVVDRADVSYFNWESQSVEKIQDTPHVRFADSDFPEDGHPIISNRNGDLILAPGNDDTSTYAIRLTSPVFAGEITSSRDVTGRRFYAERDDTTKIGDYGAGGVRLYDGGVRQVELSSGRLQIESSDSSQPAGIWVSGSRTHIQGRMNDNHAADDMFVSGNTGSNSAGPGEAVRGSVTFGTPTPQGSRRTNVWAHVSGGSYDDWDVVNVSSAGLSGSGFDWVARAESGNNGTATFWVYYFAHWR